MKNDWTSEWKPPPKELPPLDAETLAAVHALQQGEVEDSTRRLMATFEPQLGAYFRRQGCQHDEAEDLAQTVFLRMLEQIGTLKKPERFQYWLFKIGGNALRNFLRDRGRERDAFDDLADKARKDSETSAFWARGSFEPGPEARLVVREAVERRRRVLRRLLGASRLAPATLRSLLLRLRGASYDEIAGALEVPAGTVASHVSRAVASLVKKLETIDPSAPAGDDAGDDFVAGLSSELLTFKREAMEADPYYARAGGLESASSEFEKEEEAVELEPRLFAEKERKNKKKRVPRVADSPAAIAAVVRQDRLRGRPRRRPAQAIPRAEGPTGAVDPGPLSRDDLDLPLMLLDEVAASNGAADHADGRLALTAKLTCAGALLTRDRSFPAARRAKDAVEVAILLIGKPGAGFRDKVALGRGLLRSTLDNG
jgi:RNA polymerase sigma-70 factor, ECF subfamily